MVRAPYTDKNGLKKGAWSKEEDDKLKAYIQKHGHWNWRQLPKFAGLQRCGKSCRIRWLNYLRPDVKRGGYSKEEEDLIIQLYEQLGSKWSKIAEHLPGRTDNEIKNHWHTHLKKRRDNRRQITTSQEELKEQTIASSQEGVIFQDVAVVKKEENGNDSALKDNPTSQPITILESSPFLPSTSSTASPSINAAFAGLRLEGDDVGISTKENLWSEEEDEKLRAYIQRHGLVPTVWSDVLEADAAIKKHEQLGKLRSTTYEETENHSDFSRSPETIENKEQLTGSPILLAVANLPDPTLVDNNFQSTKPEYSPGEASFFSSDINMVDATAPMDWINHVDESWNRFEIFEADFWTQPFVLDLDTSATKYTCPMFSSNPISWELSYIH